MAHRGGLKQRDWLPELVEPCPTITRERAWDVVAEVQAAWETLVVELVDRPEPFNRRGGRLVRGPSRPS